MCEETTKRCSTEYAPRNGHVCSHLRDELVQRTPVLCLPPCVRADLAVGAARKGQTKRFFFFQHASHVSAVPRRNVESCNTVAAGGQGNPQLRLQLTSQLGCEAI